MSPELAAKTWIIVPAYNEGRRVRPVLLKLTERFPNIVLIDDGSKDDTCTQAQIAGVNVVRHSINLGQGAALQTGIDYALQAGGEYFVTFDSDGQHNIDEVDAVMEPVVRGDFDITLGSRFLGEATNIPGTRKLILKIGILFTWLISGIRLTDTHNGFRAFNRKAATTLRITQNRMAHASEILDQIVARGLRYREVPVTITYSDDSLEKGQSSFNSVKIALQMLVQKFIN